MRIKAPLFLCILLIFQATLAQDHLSDHPQTPASLHWLSAPNPSSPAVNQLRTDGNACGPACLLDSFRAGSQKWRQSIAKIKGPNDHATLKKIIRNHGKLGSRLDPKKARWNGRYGINGMDLADIANELRSERWMGRVTQKIFFQNPRESDRALLKRVHKRLSHSLKKGLPPTLRVRRVALRSVRKTPQGPDHKTWLAVKSHFLVLTGLPAKLPKNALSFPVTYHDPWGGKKLKGHVRIAQPTHPGLATLLADFPGTTVGKSLLRSGEGNGLSLSSAIGLF